MNIAAGKLRHRLEIYKPIKRRDEYGSVILDKELFAKVWGAIEPLSGREFIAAQAAQSNVRYNITIRYRPGITADFWIEHKGLKYDIAGVLVDKDSGQEYIVMPAYEGASVNGQ